MFRINRLFTLLFSILTITLSAQETFSSSGLNTSGSNGEISYSIGQIATELNSGINGSVSQGIQQPYEIYSTVGSEISNIDLKLITYPNPTTDNLILSIDGFKNQILFFQLFSFDGKLLIDEECSGNITNINLKSFPSNTYLLNIIKNQSIIKTFRIIKN
ncbi:MAG: T9SS type A sorting domain-containing protein [Flavobacteriales bacterium]|nr:T9SS type A sorting domain-containing protein [Flavobacteriales bacterium]